MNNCERNEFTKYTSKDTELFPNCMQITSPRNSRTEKSNLRLNRLRLGIISHILKTM